MGRGNCCVFGKHEGLYYVDYDNIHAYFKEQLISDFIACFPEFTKVKDKWIDDVCIILQSDLFFVGLEDNGDSVCIKLLQKESDIPSFDLESLQEKYSDYYLSGLKQILFEQFNEIGIYSGAWTRKYIKKEEQLEKNKQLPVHVDGLLIENAAEDINFAENWTVNYIVYFWDATNMSIKKQRIRTNNLDDLKKKWHLLCHEKNFNPETVICVDWE